MYKVYILYFSIYHLSRRDIVGVRTPSTQMLLPIIAITYDYKLINSSDARLFISHSSPVSGDLQWFSGRRKSPIYDLIYLSAQRSALELSTPANSIHFARIA